MLAKRIALLVALASMFGCAARDSEDTEVLGASVELPIVGGQPASAFTEAALISGNGFICSGAIIAPRVALTAGHCVDGSSWTVTAPYAGGQKAKSTGKWTEYVSQADYVNASTNDVALIFLDKPIQLAWYPPIASAKVASGTKAVNVGRIQNGTASYSGLFFGKEVTLKPGSQCGYPLSYCSEEVIQSGDSGGPVYVGSGSSRTIVAVNSGSGGGTQVLARVDLAYAKIQDLVAQHGGSGASPTPSTTTPPPPPPSPPACPSQESEPNDDSTDASALAGKTCGALATGSDLDWFEWSVSGAGIAYDLSLDATGDAEILMWKWSSGAWHPITGASPTHIAATSNGAGDYVVVVRSPGAAAQTYALTLAK